MTAEVADNVLSTLRPDGSRRWLRPRLSHGRHLTARRIVAYFLMGLFLALPFLHVNNKPAVLLDIVHRRFTLFGYTFLPTDTILLAFTMLFIFVSIFLFTALFGRLWCGWACPQTVYMEFLYRPLERLFEGTARRGGPPVRDRAWGKVAYFFAAFLVTAIPAHTFLAYFVGVDALSHWMRQSPVEHPTAFLVMAATVSLMMFDFYWFREQMCLIACPYGRFQSVLLDQWSRIVSYDKRRGEPRGKLHRSVTLPLAEGGSAAGDCIDCHMCVATCPTGIDIRDGLQMECINCTQCIDACDAVMTRINKPRGLIRYSSQAAVQGDKPAKFRPRLVFYPVILLILAIAWLLIFSNKGTADITLLRNYGNPFTRLETGRIASPIRLKITNRSDVESRYVFDLPQMPDATIDLPDTAITVPANESRTVAFEVELPPEAFHMGVYDGTLHITNNRDFSRELTVRLLGPFSSGEEPGHDRN
ncbi:MAG TPA: cytochrome c oxidase accessory protein CcoG [Phycisphaerae bacterium]|nr:cytochrome c oxidase accessory protein CcoG [Phycisphaerae bacterium]